MNFSTKNQGRVTTHNDCLTVMVVSGDGAAAMFDLTQHIKIIKQHALIAKRAKFMCDVVVQCQGMSASEISPHPGGHRGQGRFGADQRCCCPSRHVPC